MGKTIEEIAVDRGHTVKHKININNINALKFIEPSEIDVAIEFSQPDAAFSNLTYCIEHKIPVVCGTTGWLDKYDEIAEKCKKSDSALFYASNFSVGVNLFFHLNKRLAKMISGYTDYDVSMTEIHHTEKLDAPSGTAITLAEGVMEMIPTKTQWINEDSDVKSDLVINSLREPNVPGTHIVKYNSEIDEIEIKHVAHSRRGFAQGAVLVAEWLKNKKGVFSMDDFLKFND